jgi:glyoxylase-like metal-dependent hydrolase (beta-lactamase superfamily II)
MPIDRRTLLATTAAALAATTLPARAQRLTHGGFEITVVSDGHILLPTSFLAPTAPGPERTAALTEAGQTAEQYPSPTNVTLIRAGNETILVDAGGGPRFVPTTGRLVDNLEAAGVDREAITMVVLTHGHPDHLWGVTDDLDELTFPKARYLISATEHDFWRSPDAAKSLPEERAGFVTGARRNLARIEDKLTRFKPGDEIVSGLRAIDTAGHTQGHVSLELAGGDGLMVLGDALTHPVISFRHPEWKPMADHDPDRAIATRKALLDRLAAGKTRIVGYHLPYPGTGYVERKDGAYRFVAG